MNMELTVNDNSGRSMAEMMGVDTSTGPQKASSLARLNILHTALMGEVEVAGKLRNTEVLPVGTFSLKIDEDIIYVAKPSIRIFAMRQQYAKWDAENNKMDRTVLANDLKSDLKDSRGTFNIGRPLGFVTDWENLPQKTKDIMRVVKRTKVLFGTIKINGGAMNSNGEPVKGYDNEIPFILDIKNNTSIKCLDAAVKSISKTGAMPIAYTVELGSIAESMPTGATFATMTFTVKNKVDLIEEDSTTFQSFLDWIEWSNTFILAKWDEHNKQDTGASDEDLVADFVDIEGTAV